LLNAAFVMAILELILHGRQINLDLI
jgi:hypothetical protein